MRRDKGTHKKDGEKEELQEHDVVGSSSVFRSLLLPPSFPATHNKALMHTIPPTHPTTNRTTQDA